MKNKIIKKRHVWIELQPSSLYGGNLFRCIRCQMCTDKKRGNPPCVGRK